MSKFLFAALALLLAGIASAQGEISYRIHYKPADHLLDDAHPFFRDGECFLYYLKPKNRFNPDEPRKLPRHRHAHQPLVFSTVTFSPQAADASHQTDL